MSAETKEPGLVAILLSAFSMIWLGLLLGVLALLSVQPKAFNSLSDRDRAIESKTTPYLLVADSHYFSGPVLRGSGWAQKRELLLAGTPGLIELSAGEVNGWLESNFRPQAGANAESSGVSIVPQAPNFAMIEDGLLHLNLPAQFSGFGMQGDFVMHAVGRFEQGAGSSPEFKILRCSVNAAPLPAWVGQQVYDSIIEAYRQSEELQAVEAAWDEVDSAELAGGTLRLQIN